MALSCAITPPDVNVMYNPINKIRSMGEGTTGSISAFWADLGANTPPLLLSRPIVEASSMETFDATGTETILCFGDFSRYVIADRVGTTVELSSRESWRMPAVIFQLLPTSMP